MRRFKGLEYRRIIIAAVVDGLVPRRVIMGYRDSDPRRHRCERQRARSLLFVAATRARDELAVSWHGNPSRFLTSRLNQPARQEPASGCPISVPTTY
jgi:superfamily I DNA/RNA helicase